MAQNSLSNRFTLESYGIRIGVEANRDEILEKVKKILPIELPERYKIVKNEFINHFFSLNYTKKGDYSLVKNGEKLACGISEEDIIKYFGREIRITVAEFAKGKVFLHAGVVGHKGQAIIIPASSFRGKTTLVAELIKKGALYYSDEYAVLDEAGLVQPFPKMLSVRGIINEYTQMDCPVESFGGEVGKEPLPVGLVLIAEYKKDAKWNIKFLSPAQGIMEMLNHTIPIRHKPKFALEVLKRVANRAIIAKTKRGEAEEFAGMLLNFFESEMIQK